MTFPGFRILLLGIRPKTLTMSLMPVLVACALVLHNGMALNFLVMGCIFMAAVSIQIATNLHNDAQDFINGTDTKDRIGPQRITQSGLATPQQTRNSANLFIGVAIICGSYLVYSGGWPIIVIGVASLLSAYGYSSGPLPLSRGPFGELFVLIFFGVLALGGSYYLLSDQWSADAFILGVLIGSPACGVLVLNNYRDLENDTIAGRKTLAILAGPGMARGLYIMFLLAPYFMLPALYPISLELCLPYIGMIPGVIAIKRMYLITQKIELNKCLAISAASQTALSVGLSVYLYLTSGHSF